MRPGARLFPRAHTVCECGRTRAGSPRKRFSGRCCASSRRGRGGAIRVANESKYGLNGPCSPRTPTRLTDRPQNSHGRWAKTGCGWISACPTAGSSNRVWAAKAVSRDCSVSRDQDHPDWTPHRPRCKAAHRPRCKAAHRPRCKAARRPSCKAPRRATVSRAAVDAQIHAGDETRFLRCEEQNRPRRFVGFAHALHRHRVLHHVAQAFECLARSHRA